MSKPAELAVSTTLMIPLTGRKSPSKESSPTNRASLRSRARSWPERTRTAKAMERSRWVPVLSNSAGARLMVSLSSGKVKPELVRAERTRSLDSETVLLAMPTMLNDGRPREESPSTETSRPE